MLIYKFQLYLDPKNELPKLLKNKRGFSKWRITLLYTNFMLNNDKNLYIIRSFGMISYIVSKKSVA